MYDTETLDKQIDQLSEVIEKVHTKVVYILDLDKDPRGRIAIAEFIQAYANLHRTLLDVKRHKDELPQWEVLVEQKRRMLSEESSVDLFELQKALQQLNMLSTGKCTPVDSTTESNKNSI